jgi:Flp pilus assembly pilin Flp
METLKNEIRNFMEDETGMGTVEIILIIVVLVGLVIIFRQQLNDPVQRIFSKITSDSSTIIG